MDNMFVIVLLLAGLINAKFDWYPLEGGNNQKIMIWELAVTSL